MGFRSPGKCPIYPGSQVSGWSLLWMQEWQDPGIPVSPCFSRPIWALASHCCVLSLCPLVAQKIVATRKKQQLSIGPCKSLPNSPSHSSVCSAQVSAVHISQVWKVVREVRQPARAKKELGQEVLTASAQTVTTTPLNFVNNSMFYYWLPSSFRSCSGQVCFMGVNL